MIYANNAERSFVMTSTRTMLMSYHVMSYRRANLELVHKRQYEHGMCLS
jgi:hypothetical protein